jgi:hypothetical protein
MRRRSSFRKSSLLASVFDGRVIVFMAFPMVFMIMFTAIRCVLVLGDLGGVSFRASNTSYVLITNGVGRNAAYSGVFVASILRLEKRSWV